MKEQIYEDFKKRRAEALSRPEFTEKELSLEAEKQILREIVSEHIQKAQSASGQEPSDQSVDQIKTQPKERQVEFLVNLAIEKGIPEAIKTVKKLDNPYLVDELHDVLVDELYNQLIETGKLEKI